MRLRELTEAKFRKSAVMYHGTSSEFLPSILKQGMIPEPKRKRWDVDPDSSLGTHSRVSLTGSYWTSNLLTATGSARNTANKFGGNSIVVIAKIQTQSAMTDEDNINFSLDQSYDESLGGSYTQNPGLVASVFYDAPDDYEKARAKFTQILHSRLTKNEQKPVPEGLLEKTFDAMSLRIIAHGIRSAGNDKYWSPLGRVSNKPNTEPTVDETEKNLSMIKDKLTRYYRESTTDTEIFRHTLRITEPVTFRGANRITHIIEIPDGYFKNKEYIQPPIIVHYGNKKDLPEKFISDYTTRKGEFPGIAENIEKSRLGYKVMELGDGIAISHADKKLTIPLKKDKNLKFRGNGLYLSNNKQFVIDHYSGLSDNAEILLVFEYNPNDVLSGSDQDTESDFTVSSAKLVGFEILNS